MKVVVWGLVVLLVVIHQDIWFWNDDRLVLGFLPITLAYHACISIAASIVWFLAIQFAWPEGLDDRPLDSSTPSQSHAASTPPAGLLSHDKSPDGTRSQEGGAA